MKKNKWLIFTAVLIPLSSFVATLMYMFLTIYAYGNFIPDEKYTQKFELFTEGLFVHSVTAFCFSLGAIAAAYFFRGRFVTFGSNQMITILLAPSVFFFFFLRITQDYFWGVYEHGITIMIFSGILSRLSLGYITGLLVFYFAAIFVDLRNRAA